MNKKNINSHLTAIERTTLSYPARILFNQNKIIGKVLDFGCGIGKDVELLKDKGIDIIGYDPFYFPIQLHEKYDTILCFYVLNVLLPEEQNQVLMRISTLLKPNGKAYFAVRRDVYYQGFRIHKMHKKETYQCQVKLPYNTIFLNQNCEIYEYEPYTTLNKGKTELSPFLKGNDVNDIVMESANAFSIFDKYPVSEGHTLVIPKNRISNYFDLTPEEQMECWNMVNEIKKLLQTKYNPEGFNIGINIDETAGQTIFHCHIHIIPRYKGDVENPRGGVRGVIPSKKDY